MKDLLKILTALESPYLIAGGLIAIRGSVGWAALLVVSTTIGMLWLLAMCQAAKGN